MFLWLVHELLGPDVRYGAEDGFELLRVGMVVYGVLKPPLLAVLFQPKTTGWAFDRDRLCDETFDLFRRVGVLSDALAGKQTSLLVIILRPVEDGHQPRSQSYHLGPLIQAQVGRPRQLIVFAGLFA